MRLPVIDIGHFRLHAKHRAHHRADELSRTFGWFCINHKNIITSRTRVTDANTNAMIRPLNVRAAQTLKGNGTANNVSFEEDTFVCQAKKLPLSIEKALRKLLDFAVRELQTLFGSGRLLTVQ